MENKTFNYTDQDGKIITAIVKNFYSRNDFSNEEMFIDFLTADPVYRIKCYLAETEMLKDEELRLDPIHGVDIGLNDLTTAENFFNSLL